MGYAIIGTGGVGGYLAARLLEAGHDVAVLARGAHLAAIRADGLTLRETWKEPGRETVVRPAVATDDGAALGTADVAIFAVKGQDLAAAIEVARPAVGPETLVLPFLNGVEAPGLLAEAYGDDRALIGIARIFAFIAAPGVVEMAGPTAEFTIGGLDGSQSDPRVRTVIESFRAAGIAAPDCADLRVDLWTKFVFLTAIAGVTAGARVDLDTVRRTPELWALYVRLAEEARAVGEARGIALGEAVQRAIASGKSLPGASRASLAHDLAGGKRLETDWLNGAVVRLGAEAGVDAPAHATVAALLAPWREGGGG
jgi:2-dehydropantoate 2-reductase